MEKPTITPYQAFKSQLFNEETNLLSDFGILNVAEAILLELDLNNPKYNCQELKAHLNQNREEWLSAKAKAKEIRLEIPGEFKRIMELRGTNHFLFGEIPKVEPVSRYELYKDDIFDSNGKQKQLSNFGLLLVAQALILNLNLATICPELDVHLKNYRMDFIAAHSVAKEIETDDKKEFKRIQDLVGTYHFFFGDIPLPKASTPPR